MLRERDESVERLRGGPGIERLFSGADAGFERVGAARHVDRGAGVERRQIARRAFLAGEDAACDGGVVLGRAAGDVLVAAAADS